jgi:hypothetical protein
VSAWNSATQESMPPLRARRAATHIRVRAAGEVSFGNQERAVFYW